MDIQALKIDLAQKILKSEDQQLLSAIDNLFREENENDWWNQLPKEVQDSIFEGIQDIEKGNIFTNDQVIQEAKLKYGF